jgi:hypothetical protein
MLNSGTKIAVVTCNTARIDTIKDIPQQTVAYDRFYYTSKKLPFPMTVLNDRIKSKYVKTQMHRIPELKGYDVLLWLDGSIQVKSEKFVEFFTKDPFVIGKHPDRNCILDEAGFIENEIRNGNKYLESRYNGIDLMMAALHYNNKGYVRNSGLWASGVFGMWNVKQYQNLCDQWWENILQWDGIDQISLGYLLSQRNMYFKDFEYGNMISNDLFDLIPHAF